jgi:hypothetical protein
MRLDDEMRRLAARQHGLVSRAQVRSVGGTASALKHRVASGAWQPLSARVLRLAGAPVSFEQRCLAAVLDAGPGAALSHVSAAALLGVPGFDGAALHVSRLHAGAYARVRPLARLHDVVHLPEHHVTVVRSVPVTTLARTLFDLAGSLRPARTARALDNSLNLGLVPLETVRRTSIELFERGRDGTTVMRDLLERRQAGYVPPASSLEARFLAILIAAGEDPLPDLQVDAGGDDGWIGRADFRGPEPNLLFEIDSERHHTALLDAESDRSRDERFWTAGFHVVRITEAMLDDPAEVLRRYREGRAVATAQALKPPARSAARVTPRSTKVAAARLELKPSEHTTTTRRS